LNNDQPGVTFIKEKFVLVVDDEGTMKEYLEEVMKRHGYRYASFVDPSEVLVFVQTNSNKIDLVVTDIRMPGITGYDLAKEILKINPNIPVILISAYFPSLNAVEEAPNVKRVLSKPLSTRHLIEAVETEISESAKTA
jgi:DNA-binding NtrC family response regulator